MAGKRGNIVPVGHNNSLCGHKHLDFGFRCGLSIYSHAANLLFDCVRVRTRSGFQQCPMDAKNFASTGSKANRPLSSLCGTQGPQTDR